MLLKDTFYTLDNLSTNDSGFTAEITINAGHTIFSGHFPGNPVTPGVIEMEIVKEITALGVNQEVKLLSMSNSKFLAILNPVLSSNVQVKIQITEKTDETVRISAQILDTQTVFLKMSAEYQLV